MMRYGHLVRPDLKQVDWIHVGIRGSLLTRLTEVNVTAFGGEVAYWRSLSHEFVLSAEQIAIPEKVPDTEITIDNSAQLYTLGARLAVNDPVMYPRGFMLGYYGIEAGILKSNVTMSVNGNSISRSDYRVNSSSLSAEAGVRIGVWYLFLPGYGADIGFTLMYLFQGGHSTNVAPPYVLDPKGRLYFGATITAHMSPSTGFLDVLKDLN
jgi:hypothetical protein